MVLIPAHSFSFEIFLAIVNLYDEIAGASGKISIQQQEYLFKGIISNIGIRYFGSLFFTFGSVLSDRSQLRINTFGHQAFGLCLFFELIPEIQPYDYDKDFNELTREIMADFEFAVDEFLEENELAVDCLDYDAE